jgi:hypothetical protein
MLTAPHTLYTTHCLGLCALLLPPPLLLLLLLLGWGHCVLAAAFVWFIALAIPFFGVVNDLLGAFCVTFET